MDFQTVERFAQRIQMSVPAVYRAIREGQFPFPFVRIGKQIRIDARAINQNDTQNQNSEPKGQDANLTPSKLAA